MEDNLEMMSTLEIERIAAMQRVIWSATELHPTELHIGDIRRAATLMERQARLSGLEDTRG